MLQNSRPPLRGGFVAAFVRTRAASRLREATRTLTSSATNPPRSGGLLFCSPFAHRLKRPAVSVVEGFMQQKNVVRGDAQVVELPLQLGERDAIEAALEERAEVVGAQVDFNGV